MKKLSIILTLVIFIGASVSFAGEMMKISGKITATFTDEQRVEIGDVEGHEIAFITSEGTNASTGDMQFLEGAKVINYSMGDIHMGSGPQHGYIKVWNENDGMISKWEHELVTVMTAEGMPSTTFKGTFTYTGGMGKYAKIKGGGTYTGKFISKTEYVVEWKGEYTLAKEMNLEKK